MWVDEHGVAHTVAVPEPKGLMTKSFRSSLDAVVRTDFTGVEDALTTAEEELFETEPAAVDPSVEARFEGQAPPRKILRGSFRHVPDVLLAIERVDHRWRLDAILALEDYIE